MNKNLIVCALFALLGYTSAWSITAKEVLDKAAATVSHKGGVTAHFTITSPKYGDASGTISVKGNKFYATTPLAIMWFDGKTQWTYMKKSDEVNVSNPTEAQLQSINPYNFINMYKHGFSYTMQTTNNCYKVHLKATDAKRSVKEMYITANKSTFAPVEVKMLQGKNWTTITISQLKKSNLGDAVFRFNSKDFPQAEVIDLR